MADSPLEAIEAAVVAELQLVPGMAAGGVRAVPLSLAFRFRHHEDGTVEMAVIEMPYAYPGAIVCVNDQAIETVKVDQQNGSSVMRYRVPIVVSIYATSDGSVAGAAHRAAWKIAHAAMSRLCVFTPAGMPEGTQSFGPLRPGNYEAITVDPSTHGIAMRFEAQYQTEVFT